MAEKKHFSVSFPGIPYFFSDDPEWMVQLTELNPTADPRIEEIRHLLSDKPLRRQAPRTKSQPTSLEPESESKPT